MKLSKIKDACYSNLCLNGGSCAISSTSPFYTCTCINGYSGSTCQKSNFYNFYKFYCSDQKILINKALKTMPAWNTFIPGEKITFMETFEGGRGDNVYFIHGIICLFSMK